MIFLRTGIPFMDKICYTVRINDKWMLLSTDVKEAVSMEQDRKQSDGTKEEGRLRKKSTWDIRPYLAMGLTAIIVVVICIAIFFLVYRFQGLSDGIGKALKSLQSILIGFILAYLLNPIMKFFERIFKKYLYGGKEKTHRQKRNIRGLSVACAMAVFLAVIAILSRLIFPQLVASIAELISTMNDKVQNLTEWINKLLKQNSLLAGQLDTLVSDVSKYLQNWLQENVLERPDWIASVTTGVYNVIRTIFNVIIGLIISVYVLMTKETFIGQFKKIIYAIFRPKYGNVVMEVIRKADDVFGGFFIGKIIDSLIIGCICFVGLSVLRMPYVALVSVIVGVTNIIPFFGPYIGAIPSAVLIFLVDPMKGIYFIIFIIILQQVDGNVIGPKILGDTTGLSPFWVIFAILLFGGSFGVLGMLFGVPVFAVIYYIVKRIVEHILRVRRLPRQTSDYIRLKNVDIETKEVNMLDEEDTRILQRDKQNRNKRKQK